MGRRQGKIGEQPDEKNDDTGKREQEDSGPQGDSLESCGRRRSSASTFRDWLAEPHRFQGFQDTDVEILKRKFEELDADWQRCLTDFNIHFSLLLSHVYVQDILERIEAIEQNRLPPQNEEEKYLISVYKNIQKHGFNQYELERELKKIILEELKSLKLAEAAYIDITKTMYLLPTKVTIDHIKHELVHAMEASGALHAILPQITAYLVSRGEKIFQSQSIIVTQMIHNIAYHENPFIHLIQTFDGFKNFMRGSSEQYGIYQRFSDALKMVCFHLHENKRLESPAGRLFLSEVITYNVITDRVIESMVLGVVDKPES